MPRRRPVIAVDVVNRDEVFIEERGRRPAHGNTCARRPIDELRRPSHLVHEAARSCYATRRSSSSAYLSGARLRRVAITASLELGVVEEQTTNMFKRKKQPTLSRLPDDLGTRLELFGREEFEPAADRFNLDARMFDFVSSMSKLQFDPLNADEMAQMAGAVRDAALAQGGFALFGGCAVIDAFLPSMADGSAYSTLQDAWLAVLRSQGTQSVRMHLRPKDHRRFKELFPGEL